MTNKTMEQLELVPMPRLTMDEKNVALMAINRQIKELRQNRKDYHHEPLIVEKVDKMIADLLEAHRKIGW